MLLRARANRDIFANDKGMIDSSEQIQVCYAFLFLAFVRKMQRLRASSSFTLRALMSGLVTWMELAT